MTSLLLALVIGWSEFPAAVRCEMVSPSPTGYFTHSLKLTADGSGRIDHVAEVFPRGARHNTGTRPVVHFYRTVSRHPAYGLDNRLLWTGELVNPVMPAAALVTADGYFVTFDDWGNNGSERSVVIYAPDGRVVRTFALNQLFAGQVVAARSATCGFRWRTFATFYLASGADPKLYIVTTRWPVVELTLKTGAISRGTVANSALRDLVARVSAIQPEANTLDLRFSSITDTKR